MKYKTILADPPWNIGLMGKRGRRPNTPMELAYPCMGVGELTRLPINDLGTGGCHLWLWTTNSGLEDGFVVMREWGFTYLAPITFVKPSGIGAWFIHRTQTLLFGYKDKCEFNRERWKPTVQFFTPAEHSRKPIGSYELIESISDEPRLELFARPHSPLFPKRDGWDVWGDEVVSDISMKTDTKCI